MTRLATGCLASSFIARGVSSGERRVEQAVIVTESGMLHRLRRELPGKTFIPGPTDKCACADCRYMKMNSMEKLARPWDIDRTSVA